MRHVLTDEEWDQLQPLLPSEKPRRGRPWVSHRLVVSGIFGCSRRVCRGAIFQKSLGNGRRSSIGFGVGCVREFGMTCWKRSIASVTPKG